jgi:putative ABC transport system ATP-binding protein
MLTLNKVCKSFDHSSGPIPVLSDVDLQVTPGESVAIIGPSGSGKSTLLSLLAGLDKPDSGHIQLSGHAVDQLSEQELTSWRAKFLGIVFQQFHLISHLTTLENVLLPLQITNQLDQASQRATELLSRVGLTDRANHYPSELSGGEKQRVAIARALIGQPPLLLADEPSGNLDSQTGQQIVSLLFELVKENNMTLILVTHNATLATACDRQLLLKARTLHAQ